MAKYVLSSELQEEISYRMGKVTEKIKEEKEVSDSEAESLAQAFLLDVIYKYYKIDKIDWESVTGIVADWMD